MADYPGTERAPSARSGGKEGEHCKIWRHSDTDVRYWAQITRDAASQQATQGKSMSTQPLIRSATARTTDGERFGITWFDPRLQGRALRLWHLMTEEQFRSTLRGIGFSETDIEDQVGKSRKNVSTITGKSPSV